MRAADSDRLPVGRNIQAAVAEWNLLTEQFVTGLGIPDTHLLRGGDQALAIRREPHAMVARMVLLRVNTRPDRLSRRQIIETKRRVGRWLAAMIVAEHGQEPAV